MLKFTSMCSYVVAIPLNHLQQGSTMNSGIIEGSVFIMYSLNGVLYYVYGWISVFLNNKMSVLIVTMIGSPLYVYLSRLITQLDILIYLFSNVLL